MRVLCIEKGHPNPNCIFKDCPGIEEGKTYLVEGQGILFYNYLESVIIVYKLAGLEGYFQRELFLPCSGDEEDVLEEKEKDDKK